MNIRLEPLGQRHDRAAFSCGDASVDGFLKQIARQRQERRLASTIVAVDADGDRSKIVAYFTLIPHEFRGAELRAAQRQRSRVGQLRTVPGALLALLGVDLRYQRLGIGKHLMREVFERVAVLAGEWGCAALVTDPVDERAREYYVGFDFVPLEGHSTRMIISTAMIISALAQLS